VRDRQLVLQARLCAAIRKPRLKPQIDVFRGCVLQYGSLPGARRSERRASSDGWSNNRKPRLKARVLLQSGPEISCFAQNSKAGFFHGELRIVESNPLFVFGETGFLHLT
jgi:hypothetical protein